MGSSFKNFLIDHHLLYHLTKSSLAKTSPDYDKWNQLDSIIRPWMCQSILPTIAQPLSRLKLASTLWRTLEIMYANKTNISHTVEIFESMFTCTQGDQSLQDHFGRLQSLVQELSLYQPPTTDLHTFEQYREEPATIYCFPCSWSSTFWYQSSRYDINFFLGSLS